MSEEQNAGQKYVVCGTGQNPVAQLLIFLYVWTFRLQPRLNFLLAVLTKQFNFSIYCRRHPVVFDKVKATKWFLISVKQQQYITG
jgi:hypothetical protein